MKIVINPQMTLLAVGVLQPATAHEIRSFLDAVFGEGEGTPNITDLEDFLIHQNDEGRIIEIKKNQTSYFSLTLQGALYLSPNTRRLRDKFRAYLIRDAHRARFIVSRGVEKELVGVSPTGDSRSAIKGRAANKIGQ